MRLRLERSANADFGLHPKIGNASRTAFRQVVMRSIMLHNMDHGNR